MASSAPSAEAAGSSAGPSASPQNIAPAASAKKPRKPREPKAPKPASSAQAADQDAKPLHRPVMVCRRCRTKKIKCDLGFPSCGPCLKANESCVGLDPATGREVSRSYIAELEDRVDQLQKELEAIRGSQQPQPQPHQQHHSGAIPDPLCAPHSYAGAGATPGQPAGSSEAAAKRHLAEDRHDATERPAKRLAQHVEVAAGSGRGVYHHPLGPQRLTLGANGVESLPAKALRPSLRQLNSYASGLSPARLLCQAIQQSASAGLRFRDPKAGGEKKVSATKTRGPAVPGPPEGSAAADIEGAVKREEDGSDTRGRPETRDSAGGGETQAEPALDAKSGSATPSEGHSKKQSPFDDAEAMQYAEATETSDITVPAPEQLSKPLVDAYFERVNPQWPLLDRSTFMPRFEAACREGLSRARAKAESHAQADGSASASFHEDEVEIDLQPADGHLFHLVLAIAAAMGWTQARFSAERHHEAAMLYLDPRRASSGQHGVGAIMGRDSLEQLQCLLLTALYSMMRSTRPGIWYTLGVALRLTTGLGLYSENSGLLKGGPSAEDGAPESIANKKRRLFWCAYSIDRSVGVHLGRPFGIADTDIKVGLPWTPADDEYAEGQHGKDAPPTGDDADAVDDGVSAAGFDERASDTSTERLRKEAASTLAALGESRASSPSSAMTAPATMTGPGDVAASRQAPPSSSRPGSGSRWVSLAFFRLRILQSEIQGLLFSNAELPRRFASFEHWKVDMLDRLADWRAFAPSSRDELARAGCGYNPIFLELNFRQTLLMIYGMSPRFPTPNRSDLAHVEDCSRVILDIYAVLAKEGQLNYAWMTGHNIFISCTSYLYAIWQISASYPASLHSSLLRDHPTKVAEIEHYGRACDDVLASLQWYTAEKCRKCLRTMFAATAGLVEKLDKMVARGPATVSLGDPSRQAPQAQPRQPAQQQGQQQQQTQRLLPQPPAAHQPSAAASPSSALMSGPKDKWWDPARDAPTGWESARTSDLRSERQPVGRTDSPGLSARSLYTQDAPSRLQPSGKTPRGTLAMLPPVPTWPGAHGPGSNVTPLGGRGGPPVIGGHTSGSFSPSSRMTPLPPGDPRSRSRSGSRSSVYYSADGASMATSPHAIASGAHPDARMPWRTASPRFPPIDGPARHLSFGSPYGSGASPMAGSPYAIGDTRAGGHSAGSGADTLSTAAAYPGQPQQAGSTPSNGLEFDAIAGVNGSPGALLRQTLGASPGRISAHSSSAADSPNQIDFSSLMADSAMELDQLFRDAGLSINFDGGFGSADGGAAGLPANGDQSQQGGLGFADMRPAGASSTYLDAGDGTIGMHHHGSGGGLEGLGRGYEHGGGMDGGPGPGSTTGASWFGNGASLGGGGGGMLANSDDGLENDYDWEAMGFGFRMSQAPAVIGPDPLGFGFGGGGGAGGGSGGAAAGPTGFV
ncbi:related to PPR1 - transcription factor regulating pyrimidine pathway [Pseudozyma flocculosa]|uniref:Related to PPR1 - transcription factor regulating pyrimidine pathway n=1 Tax=Pseudozyma flocculosa TaxID=84751 RepID=A0A5C3F1A8_9BASI|nr:related to PPR1 - transcription factor regulating pyrimidine pathway [Pseudozyma flocculosa]